MSTRRHSSPAPLFRLKRGSKRRGDRVDLHRHDEAQLICAAAGTVQVHTESGRWLVPPQLAVFVPPGALHRVDVLSDVDHRMIYFHPEAQAASAPPCTLNRAFALRVTPLLRALITEVFMDGIAAEKAELISRLILHELTETPDAPTFLPLPASAVGRRVAEHALADAANRLDIAELASRAASSVRTVSRLFPAETGLTFKTWRQRARIVQAIDRLAGGAAIADAAAGTGFASTAAFCFAFRQVTGVTPSAFATGGRQRPPDRSEA